MDTQAGADALRIKRVENNNYVYCMLLQFKLMAENTRLAGFRVGAGAVRREMYGFSPPSMSQRPEVLACRSLQSHWPIDFLYSDLEQG